MGKIFIITEKSECFLSAREAVSLEDFQAWVGGYIEVIPVADNILLIVNEEGKINGQCKFNDKATLICPFDVIFGNAVLAKLDGEDIVPFDEDEVMDIRDRFLL